LTNFAGQIKLLSLYKSNILSIVYLQSDEEEFSKQNLHDLETIIFFNFKDFLMGDTLKFFFSFYQALHEQI